MKEKQENKEEKMYENGEDTTKYGEFISSYFSWIPLEKQKEKVRELQDITKINKKGQ